MKCPQCGAAMVANRSKGKLKNGTEIIRRYYSCGNFRSKGSAICSANSVRADYAEQYVYQRIKEVVNNHKILRDIVDNINHRKRDNIQPLQEELDHLKQKIASLENRKQKYFSLYEEELVDRQTLANRLEDLKAEQEKMLARQSEILWELGEENSQPIDFEYVRSLLSQLDHILDQAPTEQIKALLHLIIDEIHVKDREIQSIKLTFDESTQQIFLGCATSELSEVAFAISKQKPKFEIYI